MILFHTTTETPPRGWEAHWTQIPSKYDLVWLWINEEETVRHQYAVAEVCWSPNGDVEISLAGTGEWRDTEKGTTNRDKPTETDE